MSAQATSTIRAFERIKSQPQVRSYFEHAVGEHKISHAYLFVGPAGCGQTEIATALAKSIVCPKDGCNACEECIRVDRHSHPDVHWIKPEGAAGYVVEQVRELISDVSLSPVRSTSKVYILESVETLNATCANAMLKTIEEPPEGVIFVMMARSVDAVLPTIVSRCQCIPFRVTNQEEAVRQIALTCGVDDPTKVAIALSVTGTPEKAVEFVRSPERMEIRRLMVRTLGDLPRDDAWDVLCAARALAEKLSNKGTTSKKKSAKVEEPKTEEELAAQERAEREADFLSPKAMKLLEQRAKREITARERSGMIELIAAANSVLRDVLLYINGAQNAVINSDSLDVIERLASTADTPGVLRALEACSRATTDLSHNVSPQLILEVMLLHCKEALCPPLSR